MVGKYSLDEKLKERENGELFKIFEENRRFIKCFVHLMEDILNYEYDELSSYFEENKTEVKIKIFVTNYSRWIISACVRLNREDFSYPKLKVTDFKFDNKYDNYTINVDRFIYGSLEDEGLVNNYLQIINRQIFKDFKHDFSCNKNKIFRRYVNKKNITPSQYIIDCINKYIYNDIIKPKSKCALMTYNEFLNSEFKFDVDKKTRKIHDRYFFKHI